MKNCPCGSGKSYEECCMPYIKSFKIAETAEILMRTRYTAYTKSEIDYILNTHVSETRNELSIENIKNWADSSEWQNLSIISSEMGKENDTEGIIEFKAMYKINGLPQIHHERSYFIKKSDKWYYSNPISLPKSLTKLEKIGRNSACPCGSGKKYKKCCGK